MSETTNNRRGRFRILNTLARQYPKAVQALLSDCQVLHADRLIEAAGTEYLAWSPRFDEVPASRPAPEYLVEFSDEGDLVFRKAS